MSSLGMPRDSPGWAGQGGGGCYCIRCFSCEDLRTCFIVCSTTVMSDSITRSDVITELGVLRVGPEVWDGFRLKTSCQRFGKDRSLSWMFHVFSWALLMLQNKSTFWYKKTWITKTLYPIQTCLSYRPSRYKTQTPWNVSPAAERAWTEERRKWRGECSGNASTLGN